jgi:predicted CoA-binding protein
MARLPESVERFLGGRRIVVAGVSREGNQPSNAIFRRLRESGYEVLPVNPQAEEVEGVPCYDAVSSVPGDIDGVVLATHPDVATDIVGQCAERGVPRVWFHRSFGQGSVSDEAVRACEGHGIEAIVGGCPMMFCEPVDLGHRCMKWWLQRKGRVPR